MSDRVLWSTFQATRNDGSLVKLCIQDLPESRIDEAIQLYVKYFIPEETFHKAAGVAQNPQAVAECRVIATEMFKDPAYYHVICCEDKGDDNVGQIVGVSSIALTTVEPEAFEGTKLESDEVQMVFKLLNVTSNTQNIMKELHISNFYDDSGMIVHPEFRQLGIASEFLKARRLACVKNNVAATGALMTSIATQKAAEKDNWETALEINLDDLGHKHGVTFEDGGVRKFMIWKNPQVNLEVNYTGLGPELIMSDRVLWSTFQATRSDGSLVKLCIQDLPESRIDEAIELYVKHFIPEEAYHEAAGVAQNPQAVAESRIITTEILNDPTHHNVICCEDKGDDNVGQIVGVSSIALTTVEPAAFEGTKLESDEVQMVFKLLNETSNTQNIMKELHISNFYEDSGMIVHPEFRQLGIATEFLKARRLACVKNNVAATSALMTSIATQKAAEKDNWETVLEVNLDDLGHKYGVTFEDGGVRKLMLWKNPQFIQIGTY